MKYPLICAVLLMVSAAYGQSYKTVNGEIEIARVIKETDSTIRGILKNDSPVRAGNTTIVLKGGGEIIYDKKNSYVSHGMVSGKTRAVIGRYEYLLRDGGPIQFNSSTMDSPGAGDIYIYRINLDENTTVKIGPYSIECRGGGEPRDIEYGEYDMTLHSKGYPTELVLAKNHRLGVGSQNIEFLADSRLSFHQYFHEKIYSGYLNGDQSIAAGNNEITVRGGKDHTPTVYFDRDGRVTSAKVKSGTSLKVGARTITFQKSTVHFHKNGALKKADWLMPVKITLGDKTISIGGRPYVEFHDNGSMKKFINKSKQPITFTIGGRPITLQWNKPVSFHENEALKECYAAGATKLEVKGTLTDIRKGAKISFDSQGKIIGVK